MAGATNSYFAVVDMQVDGIIGPAGQHQAVIPGLFQFRGKKASQVG